MQAEGGNERRPSSFVAEALQASDGFLELLPIATLICDAGGRILQFNRHAVAIWGRTPQRGELHSAFVAECRFLELDGEPLPHSMLQQVLMTGAPVRDRELIVQRWDGSRVTLWLNIDPLKNDSGQVIGAVNCFLDITERKAVEENLRASRRALREEQQRMAATYEHAAIGISEVDADGCFIRVNEAICDITGYKRDDLLNNRLFRHTFKDDIDPDRDAWLRQAAGEIDFYSVEKRFTRLDGRIIWMSVRSQSVRDADGRFLYAVRVVQDITTRKLAEQRQKLLVDELNHRVKNTLATVQSIASQTLRSARDLASARSDFEARILALSKAHNLLSAQEWESTRLTEVLASEFSVYDAARISVEGPPVTLTPKASISLALVVHELVTNAAKYGALSEAGGAVRVRWRLEEGDGPLVLEWTERGGPPATAPERRGFGSRMIGAIVTGELGGSFEPAYDPAGFSCRIVVSADAVMRG